LEFLESKEESGRTKKLMKDVKPNSNAVLV
jgi:hypothetical protein